MTLPAYFARLRALAAQATPAPLTLTRYEHGGGRLYVDGPQRVLVADFFDAANREYYSAVAPEVLTALVAVAEAAQIFARIADMMEPLNLPDEHPLNECAPRAYVHLSHARRIRDALAALTAQPTGGAR